MGLCLSHESEEAHLVKPLVQGSQVIWRHDAGSLSLADHYKIVVPEAFCLISLHTWFTDSYPSPRPTLSHPWRGHKRAEVYIEEFSMPGFSEFPCPGKGRWELCNTQVSKLWPVLPLWDLRSKWQSICCYTRWPFCSSKNDISYFDSSWWYDWVGSLLDRFQGLHRDPLYKPSLLIGSVGQVQRWEQQDSLQSGPRLVSFLQSL